MKKPYYKKPKCDYVIDHFYERVIVNGKFKKQLTNQGKHIIHIEKNLNELVQYYREGYHIRLVYIKDEHK